MKRLDVPATEHAQLAHRIGEVVADSSSDDAMAALACVIAAVIKTFVPEHNRAAACDLVAGLISEMAR